MSDSGIPITFGADLGAAKDGKPEKNNWHIHHADECGQILLLTFVKDGIRIW